MIDEERSPPEVADGAMLHQFGPFELDPGGYSLTRDGEPVAVEPRVLELLAYLVANRGRVVLREELLEEVWHEQFVTEAVLARAVHGARVALADSSREPRWIHTVHGRGYRFAGPTPTVAEGDEAPRPVFHRRRWTIAAIGIAVALVAGAAWWWNGRLPTAYPGDVAVLPFVNATGDLAHDWVELGLMDLVAARLADDGGLRVVPAEQTLGLLAALGIEPEGSIPPADLHRIERGLGVGRLVGAVVSSEAGIYRLQATVHGAGTGAYSESKTGGDLLALAAEMSRELAGRLGARGLAAGSRPHSREAGLGDDPAASYALARGVHRFLSGDPESARTYFEAALDRFPGLVEARYRLARALAQLGDRERAREEAERGLELAVDTSDTALQARLHTTLGDIAAQQGDYEEAGRRFQRSLDLFTTLGDSRGRIDVLNSLGFHASQRGDWEAAEARHRQALASCIELGYEAGVAAAAHGLGVASGRRGELSAADRYFRRELEIRRRLGDHVAEARTLHNLAANAQNRGDWERAEALQLGALRLRRQVDDPEGIAGGLVNLAVTRTWRGRLESAEADADAALAVFRELGSPRGEAMALYVKAYVAKDRRWWQEAHALTEEARKIWRRLGAANREPLALATHAEIADESGDVEAAEGFAAEAHRLAEELGDRNLLAYTLRVRGRAARVGDRDETAERLLREALAVAQEVGNEGIEGSILRDLSELLLAADRAGEAEPTIELLRRRFPQSGPAALLEARALLARGEAEAACERALAARELSGELWDSTGEAILAACGLGDADA